MKRLRYLNVILTVIAVLLAGLLWVNVADTPALTKRAVADTPKSGVPNAGQQRREIVNAVKELSRDVRETNKILGSDLKVRVTNVSELKVASD